MIADQTTPAADRPQARRPAALTDLKIRNAKPAAQPYKLFDGDGLWVEVNSVTKVFRAKATLAGKQRQVTLGHYPEMRLQEARDARRDLRRQVQAGIAPLPPRPVASEAATSMEVLARKWHSYMAATTWSSWYAKMVLRRLEVHAFPAIGKLPVAQIARRHIIDLLQACVAKSGKFQTENVRQHLLVFFEESVLREDIAANPAAGLARKFRTDKRRRQPAALTIEAARAVLDKVEASTAPPSMKLLHRFAALTGVRPTEAREAAWGEVRDGVWTIPAERMKGMRGRQEAHTVFLSPPALDVLEVAGLVGRGGRFIFTTDYRLGGRDQPYSRSSMGRRLNLVLGERVHVPHGWRASMATILTQRNPGDRDLIQAMLAHQTKGTVHGRYDRTTLLSFEPRVRQLGDEWARLLLDSAPSAWWLAGLPDPKVVRLADRRVA